jgi:hypothetical protein
MFVSADADEELAEQLKGTIGGEIEGRNGHFFA